MVPSPGQKLFLASPHLLGPAAAGPIAIQARAGGWTISWSGSAGQRSSADQEAPIIDGADTALIGQISARGGARVVGTPPVFPSAALVISLEANGGKRDIAIADEPPDTAIEGYAIASSGGQVAAAYLARDPAGSLSCRFVGFSLNEALRGSDSWTRMPDYPQAPGMAGIMAGRSNGVLIAAGGANFPEGATPPWEGGTKSYYDEIYVLEPGSKAWKFAGKLPGPRAYGATVSISDGVLILGGDDGKEVFQDSLLLQWTGSAVKIIADLSLPAPVTAAVAAVLDHHVYLAGGYAAGAPRVTTRLFWRLNLAAPNSSWEVLPSWTGPTRAQGAAAAVDGAFYLVSGLEITAQGATASPPTYLKDAYRYRPGTGWEQLPDLPWSAIAAPSPAPVTEHPPKIFILGGVDGRQVGHLPRAVALPSDILYFDVGSKSWKLQPEPWPMPIVCCPGIESSGEWVFPTGESMAGKRTTQVWSWKITS